MPGVSDSSGVGRANPSIAGASGLDNNYVIDGVNVTNQGYGALGSYSIVFGSLGAYSAYVYALQHLSVATVSLYAYINPIIAVILGVMIANEPFSPRVVVAAAMVLAGIAVVRAGTGGEKS